MAKQTKVYVDTTSEGKAKALDVNAICKKLAIKGMDKRVSEYRAKARAAAQDLDAIMSTLEQGMAEAGLLKGMHLEPWFRFGKTSVVRVMGERNKVKAASTTTKDNVDELFEE